MDFHSALFCVFCVLQCELIFKKNLILKRKEYKLAFLVSRALGKDITCSDEKIRISAAV